MLVGLGEAKAAVTFHDSMMTRAEETMPDWLADLEAEAIDAHSRGETVPFEELGD